ncbi:hypothetical protein CANARDRAFT_24025 [[Candida] arabinofermentans NRRL YB-2248]|uniref:SH3 domain-containing protein n=1 Tax=[Candida] arabinofermentans NRRL YB-2248 TaxID=983967 RepID=A0A1E4SYN2_9ASCO|nr:hypothetical protein CANARDRAFT_24025 [[Candida] arabinofermentans NRRL YB-2248]
MTSVLPPVPFKAQAIWSWGGDNKDRDLGFMEGDIIEISQVEEQGQWCYGLSLRSKLAGYFPIKYVKVLELKESTSRRSLNFSQPNSRVSSRVTPPKLTPSASSTSISSVHKLGSSISLSAIGNLFQTTSTPPLSSVDVSLNSRYETSSSSANTSYTQRPADSDDDNQEDSPPPIPPKHELQTSTIKGLKHSSRFALDSSTLSTDTERSSFFGHSDFSATSAGSLMRHKDAKFQLKLQDLRENGPNTPERKDLLQNLMDDSNKTKHPKLLKKFLGGGNKLKTSPSLDDQIFDSSISKLNGLSLGDSMPLGASASTNLNEFSDKLQNSPIKQMQQLSRTSSRESTTMGPNDLKRTKTLTGSDRSMRKARVLQEECYMILQPHKAISSLNTNETIPGYSKDKKLNIDSTPLAHVDKYVGKIPNDRFTSPIEIATTKISQTFNTNLEQLRAIYIYLITRYDIITINNEKLSTKQSPSESTISDIVHSKRCSSHQLTWLFYIMAASLNIELEIILGNLKSPFDPNMTVITAAHPNNAKLTLNHSWLSIPINGEYRIIDPAMGNPTHPTNVDLNLMNHHVVKDNINFYFLTKPMDVLFTHTPIHTDHQHVTPMIDPFVQMSLPPLYSPFHICQLRLYKFNQSLFRLNDYEVIEFDLEVPQGIELRCLIKSNDSQRDHESLCQVYWKKGRRLAKIKGTLPGFCSMGFTCVYARYCGTSPVNDTDFAMVLSIPCFHKGKYKEIEWIRFNDKNSELGYDLYVKEPQIFNLTHNQSYDFTILKGAAASLDLPCKLFSPSGKIYNFETSKSDTLELRKQIREVGCWRLLVPSRNGGDENGWHVYAEWNCSQKAYSKPNI